MSCQRHFNQSNEYTFERKSTIMRIIKLEPVFTLGVTHWNLTMMNHNHNEHSSICNPIGLAKPRIPLKPNHNEP